jgi:hypothetical protein
MAVAKHETLEGAVRNDDWRFLELAGNVSDLLGNIGDSAL